MEKIIKIAASVAISLVFVTIIWWAVVQKPVETPQEDSPTGYYQPVPFQAPT